MTFLFVSFSITVSIVSFFELFEFFQGFNFCILIILYVQTYKLILEISFTDWLMINEKKYIIKFLNFERVC